MTFTASLSEIVQKNEDGMLGTHPSWCRVRLGDIAPILNGFPFPSSNFSTREGKPLLRIRDILNSKTEAYYSGEYDPSYLVQHGDLVIGMDGDFNSALWKGQEALLNQRVCKVTPEEQFYSRNFLAYVLPWYLNAINAKTSSVTVKHLSSNTIADIPLPLPPLPEQHRIVAKIEELFTKLATGVENLKIIKAQLKRYRQAVLKYAFEGKLTEEWREANKDKIEPASDLLERIREKRRQAARGKYKEIPLPDVLDLRELPEGWLWASSSEVCASVRDGTHDTPKYVEEGIPLITSKNLKENGLDFLTAKNISKEDHQQISIRSGVDEGDILFAMIGTIGNPVVVKTGRIFSIKNVALFKKNPPFIVSEYLKYWFEGLVFNKLLEKKKYLKGTTQRFIPLEYLRILPIPLCYYQEQQQIIGEVEHRLSVADEVEKVVEQSFKQSERLRQSILKKTFGGKLVPQDPTDESAEKLLERIKEEKAKREADSKKSKNKINMKQKRLI